MSHQVKVTAIKPDYQSLIPSTHVVGEWPTSYPLTSSQVLWHAPIHIWTHNKIMNM